MMKTTQRLLVVLVTACNLVACANSTFEWSANILPPPNVTELVEKAAKPSGLASPPSVIRVEQGPSATAQ